jgi:uncharacterized protein (DUF305 family)
MQEQGGQAGAMMDCPMKDKMKEGQAGAMMDCPMTKDMKGKMAGHTQHQAALESDNPAIKAYAQAMRQMHQGMKAPLTGDADRDFLAGMIPHHQGAIDMAQVVLQHGKDPKVKQLARQIIAGQKKEIAKMKAWLETGKLGKPRQAQPALEQAPAAPFAAPGGHSGH